MQNYFYCSKKYDDQFLQITHFQLHPELLPYVGPQYDTFKILLIGESHFLPNNSEYVYEMKDFLNWYEQPTESICWRDQKHIRWFRTRNIVNNFLEHDRSHAHTMFSNPADKFVQIIKETTGGQIVLNDSDAFRCFAFCNYYQRPELEAHKSMHKNEVDSSQARRIVSSIIEVLQPECIIFLSKKAFLDFETDESNSCAAYVNHPTCSHWHSENGKEKFYTIVQEYIKKRCKIDDISAVFQLLQNAKTNMLEKIFKDIQQYLSSWGETTANYAELQFYSGTGNVLPAINCPFENSGLNFALRVEVEWYLYFGICAWDKNLQTYTTKQKNIPSIIYEGMKESSETYYWWEYLPSEKEKVNFRYIGQSFSQLFDPDQYAAFMASIYSRINDYFAQIGIAQKTNKRVSQIANPIADTHPVLPAYAVLSLPRL